MNNNSFTPPPPSRPPLLLINKRHTGRVLGREHRLDATLVRGLGAGERLSGLHDVGGGWGRGRVVVVRLSHDLTPATVANGRRMCLFHCLESNSILLSAPLTLTDVDGSLRHTHT